MFFFFLAQADLVSRFQCASGNIQIQHADKSVA